MTTQANDDAQTQDRAPFEDLPGPSEADLVRAHAWAGKHSGGAPRLLEPNRKQVELRASDLESLLPEEHCAQLVWAWLVLRHIGNGT